MKKIDIDELIRELEEETPSDRRWNIFEMFVGMGVSYLTTEIIWHLLPPHMSIPGRILTNVGGIALSVNAGSIVSEKFTNDIRGDIERIKIVYNQEV